MSSSGVDGSESALLSAAGYLTTAAQEVLSTVSTTVSTPTLGSVWDDGSQRRVWPESDAVADGDGNRTGFADGAVDAILTTALEAFRITLEECRREALHYGTYDLPKLCAGKLQKVANLESSLILGPEKHGTSSLVPGTMWNDMMTRNSSNFTEEVVAGGELSLDNLYPAVVECFFVIICGYLAGRANFISTSDAKGLNTFVGTFALPALIFNSMAALDFSSVNWTFLFSISISKALVFALVVFVTILVERPIDFGKAGLFAIFCTQSNDFALGYPIIASLYRNSYPEFPSYLYLVAPISLVFLNPIGFVLMEYQKRRDRVKRGEVDSLQKSNFVLALDIFTGVSLNPVVLMTALGIAGNYAFGHRLPSILEGILKVLSSAYSATALFVLGLRLVGSMQRVSGAAFVVPAILIMTKG
ncbi:unnamed protein product [Notodromas monacha]|uniref:PIN-like protein n=1 Tax=Notodromas monacha TaxID=399045 RepID=A0A7R9BV23_9CRUS|nr:unnamed protein product [Notodromas monacha]CAG0920753.1 unnamed protein product [Notodromas monacha]